MTAPLTEFNPRSLYDVYSVAIAFRGRICGGMPRNKELIRAWVESTTGHADAKAEELIQQDAELVLNAVQEKSWIGFPEDETGGLFVPARNVKAMLKQSASLLAITKKKRGSKQILAEGLEVKAIDGGDRIYLGRKKPDGTEENAIHVMTAQGPRTALRKMDHVIGAKLSFEIWVLKTHAAETRHIGRDDVVEILRHAQENGCGASRSQGEGKFDVTGFEEA
jgi:hypothetical protein